MLSLTRKTDYALVALAHMARNGAGKVCARDLSDRVHIPVRVLTNVLNRLTRYGYLSSVRGVAGGYCLARLPEEISVREIVEAMEGPVRLARCCESEETGGGSRCQREPGCEISSPVKKLHMGIREFFDRVTVHDLAWDTISLVAQTRESSRAPTHDGRMVEGAGVRRTCCGNGERNGVVSNVHTDVLSQEKIAATGDHSE
ncbi:MAG: Rrf2 family transcriptional regulator [Phycisphaerae bacterium]|nr:Rrf2 family transcriptional regulator [Phycisphaerae bacterium]